MTPEEFNEKWKDHLEHGHYGIAISDKNAINVCDIYFTGLKREYPNFTFSQIKLKFNSPRVYLENAKDSGSELEKIIRSVL